MPVGYSTPHYHGHPTAQEVALARGISTHLRTRAERGMNLLAGGYIIQGALNGTEGLYFVAPPAVGLYIVHYSPDNGVSHCTCKDFEINGLPCKHIAGVAFHKAQIDAECTAAREVLARHAKEVA